MVCMYRFLLQAEGTVREREGADFRDLESRLGQVSIGLGTGQVLPGGFLCGVTWQAAQATEGQPR